MLESLGLNDLGLTLFKIEVEHQHLLQVGVG